VARSDVRSEEKIHVNVDRFIIIYPLNEDKLAKVLTPGGPIVIREPLASIQSKLEGATARTSK
jgi:hypothetical protein